MSVGIDYIRFFDFKNLHKTHLALGNFSLLLGTNASGKSNVRDGFRFLHGISRDYTLPEILEEKWIEGETPAWRGIRGGISEIAYRGNDKFSLAVSIATPNGPFFYVLGIRIHTRSGREIPVINFEALLDINRVTQGRKRSGNMTKLLREPHYWIYEARDQGNPLSRNVGKIKARLRTENQQNEDPTITLSNTSPLLSQIASSNDVSARIRTLSQSILDVLGSMRFFDLQPEAMRRPSLPGQTILGDQGENLSSVLLAMCEDPQQKERLIEWVRKLTPMDVVDLDFPTDPSGRVLVSLVESDQRSTSAQSASDGTLRFLGIITALLAPEPVGFYFFEELENGIDPSRLHLLLQLIEQEAANREIQVIATTHSPSLLGLTSSDTLKSTSLIYRLPDSSEARISPLSRIPEIQEILEQQNIEKLHEPGWLEDMIAFAVGKETDDSTS